MWKPVLRCSERIGHIKWLVCPTWHFTLLAPANFLCYRGRWTSSVNITISGLRRLLFQSLIDKQLIPRWLMRDHAILDFGVIFWVPVIKIQCCKEMQGYVQSKSSKYSRISLYYSIHSWDIALKECDPFVDLVLGETPLPYFHAIWRWIIYCRGQSLGL